MASSSGSSNPAGAVGVPPDIIETIRAHKSCSLQDVFHEHHPDPRLQTSWMNQCSNHLRLAVVRSDRDILMYSKKGRTAPQVGQVFLACSLCLNEAMCMDEYRNRPDAVKFPQKVEMFFLGAKQLIESHLVRCPLIPTEDKAVLQERPNCRGMEGIWTGILERSFQNITRTSRLVTVREANNMAAQAKECDCTAPDTDPLAIRNENAADETVSVGGGVGDDISVRVGDDILVSVTAGDIVHAETGGAESLSGGSSPAADGCVLTLTAKMQSPDGGSSSGHSGDATTKTGSASTVDGGSMRMSTGASSRSCTRGSMTVSVKNDGVIGDDMLVSTAGDIVDSKTGSAGGSLSLEEAAAAERVPRRSHTDGNRICRARRRGRRREKLGADENDNSMDFCYFPGSKSTLAAAQDLPTSTKSEVSNLEGEHHDGGRPSYLSPLSYYNSTMGNEENDGGSGGNGPPSALGPRRAASTIAVKNSSSSATPPSERVDGSLSFAENWPAEETEAKCAATLNVLLRHEHAWVFNRPVDPKELRIPDYFEIITKPMDLGTIGLKLDQGDEYRSFEEFCEDVCLVFDNAIRYNPKDNEVHIMAKKMKKYFQKHLQDSCCLCGHADKLFCEKKYACNHCNRNINRQWHFYSDKENNYHLCSRCHNKLGSCGEIPTEYVGKLIRRKNKDEARTELWVECGKCTRRLHQICALFDARENKDQRLRFTCPWCTDASCTGTAPMAQDLHRTKLSDHLETHVRKKAEAWLHTFAKEEADAQVSMLSQSSSL